MNIHKSQLFWCELQGYKVLTHCQITMNISPNFRRDLRLLPHLFRLAGTDGQPSAVGTPPAIWTTVASTLWSKKHMDENGMSIEYIWWKHGRNEIG